MKTSCKIIKDLLPLYVDDICSSESRKLVDGHLLECDECKSELIAMSKDYSVDIQNSELQDTQAIVSISKKWKKGLFASFFKGALITLVCLAIIIFILSFIVEIKVFPKSP